jgi:hypothetical protein
MLDDLGDRPLARVDGLDLLLELNLFGGSPPGLDKAIGLGSESVGVEFGLKRRGRIRTRKSNTLRRANSPGLPPIGIPRDSK